jgi:hypothetical protein
MNPQVLEYLPLVSPVATLMIVFVGILFSNRHIDVRIADLTALFRAENATLRAEMKLDNAELRAEMKRDNAELRSEMNLTLLRLENKIDHIADMVASHSERLDKLEGGRGN